MVEIGRMNRLKAVKMVDFGMYLDGGEGVEILLPTRYVPVGGKVGGRTGCLYLSRQSGTIDCDNGYAFGASGRVSFFESEGC